jgi:hypothetical protein
VKAEGEGRDDDNDDNDDDDDDNDNADNADDGELNFATQQEPEPATTRSKPSAQTKPSTQSLQAMEFVSCR